MLSERDIEAAHPDAFDFVFGNLAEANRAGFSRHLSGCRYCQAVVGEYADIGQIIQQLPPHVEPPAGLEDRTVTAMVAALAEGRAGADPRSDAQDQAVTRLYPRPERQPSGEPETQVRPLLQLRPPAGDDDRPGQSPVGQPAPVDPQVRPLVTRLPVWRRHRERLMVVFAAAAAVIIAAAIAIPRLGGSQGGPAQASVSIVLHATTAAKVFGAATGQATARQDASGSWDITLTVRHLKSFGDTQWYECWYVNQKLGQVAPAGSFQVPASGNGTFHMTSAADPRDFPLMEITFGPPSSNGAKPVKVVLSGQTL